MQCFIISLDHDKPQPRALRNALQQQGVDAQFFVAVDGRQQMPALEPGERLDQRRAVLLTRAALTRTQVACYLSHLRLLRQAYEQGLAWVCILEEDVEIEADFARILQELETLPQHCELVRLMGLRVRRRKIVSQLGAGSHRLVRPERGWCGTQGYVVSRAGMARILRHGTHIVRPIDKFYDRGWEFDLKSYGVEPHLIYEQDSPSTISKPCDTAWRDQPLTTKFAFHALKLWFSVYRDLYRLAHFREFYPASRGSRHYGKTRRIH